MSGSELKLRYGCNPHQAPARVYTQGDELPIEVLNGNPGYINLLDAVNSWQLVKELKAATGHVAAASFKHVSPAGAALGLPLDTVTARMLFVDDMELSPAAAAYARARGADRMSSYGDWAAISDPVDTSAAGLLKREVSDGIIAPGYGDEALRILREKKDGKFPVVRIDPSYAPPLIEARQVYGIWFEQRRNDVVCSADMFRTVVTNRKDLPPPAVRDLLVAQIALKYTQSNSVVLALDGQVIGTGAGQQSRVHCTRLAASKADRWFLRRHPAVLDLHFKPGVKRPDRDNAIDQFLEDDATPAEEAAWRETFENVPRRLSLQERRQWLDTLANVAMASDAFFPFRDSIDRASRSGVTYVAEPGGALRGGSVIEACNEYGMVMAFTGVRLFHH